MTDIDLMEFMTDMCNIKSDLRLLGFNEETISKYLQRMNRDELRDIIEKQKNAQRAMSNAIIKGVVSI